MSSLRGGGGCFFFFTKIGETKWKVCSYKQYAGMGIGALDLHRRCFSLNLSVGVVGGESQTHRNITVQGICPWEPKLQPLREEEPRTEKFTQLHLTSEDMEKLLVKDSDCLSPAWAC